MKEGRTKSERFPEKSDTPPPLKCKPLDEAAAAAAAASFFAMSSMVRGMRDGMDGDCWLGREIASFGKTLFSIGTLMLDWPGIGFCSSLIFWAYVFRRFCGTESFFEENSGTGGEDCFGVNITFVGLAALGRETV